MVGYWFSLFSITVDMKIQFRTLIGLILNWEWKKKSVNVFPLVWFKKLCINMEHIDEMSDSLLYLLYINDLSI